MIVGYLLFVATFAARRVRSSAGPTTEVDLTAGEVTSGHRVARAADVEPRWPLPRYDPDEDPPDVPCAGAASTAPTSSSSVVAVIGGAAVRRSSIRIVFRMHSTRGTRRLVVRRVHRALLPARHATARDAEAALDRVVTVIVWSIGILVAAVLRG